jgi:hypothetical protein
MFASCCIQDLAVQLDRLDRQDQLDPLATRDHKVQPDRKEVKVLLAQLVQWEQLEEQGTRAPLALLGQQVRYYLCLHSIDKFINGCNNSFSYRNFLELQLFI